MLSWTYLLVLHAIAVNQGGSEFASLICPKIHLNSPCNFWNPLLIPTPLTTEATKSWRTQGGSSAPNGFSDYRFNHSMIGSKMNDKSGQKSTSMNTLFILQNIFNFFRDFFLPLNKSVQSNYFFNCRQRRNCTQSVCGFEVCLVSLLCKI